MSDESTRAAAPGAQRSPLSATLAALATLALAVAGVGCSERDSFTRQDQSEVEVRAKEIRLGCSRAEFESKLAEPATLQFVTTLDSRTYVCLSASFAREWNAYYFIFEEDVLASILNSGRFLFPDGDWPLEGDSEQITLLALDSPSLSESSFAAELHADLDVIRERFKKDRPIQLAFSLPEELHAEHQQWLSVFDARKLRLGMTRAEVNRVIAPPRFRLEAGKLTTYAYGPAEVLYREEEEIYLGDNVKYWLAVAFENDKVTRIWANDFFREESLLRAELELPR